MDALGGEDYSYYLFDVKNVNESERAKKVVEMVVYVPQAQRVTYKQIDLENTRCP